MGVTLSAGKGRDENKVKGKRRAHTLARMLGRLKKEGRVFFGKLVPPQDSHRS